MLEFVHVEEERATGGSLGVLAHERDLVELGDEERSKERGVLLPDCALRELAEEDPARFDQRSEVDRIVSFGNHPPQQLCRAGT